MDTAVTGTTLHTRQPSPGPLGTQIQDMGYILT